VLISVSLCVQHVVRPASKEYPDAAEVKGCIAIPCKSYGVELLRHLLNIHRDGILVFSFTLTLPRYRFTKSEMLWKWQSAFYVNCDVSMVKLAVK